MSDVLSSNAKIFVDGMFSFFKQQTFQEKKNLATSVKDEFQTRSAKQAREVVFSRNVLKAAHRLLTFCKYIVSQALSQKHIDVTLDERLRFEEHLKMILSKLNTNRNADFLHKLQNLLQRKALIANYKFFIRPHLDNGDITYNQKLT